LSQFNYFGPRNFGVFASYYTETLLYSNFRGSLFSRTCQAQEIREIKGTRKKLVLQYLPVSCLQVTSHLLNEYEFFEKLLFLLKNDDDDDDNDDDLKNIRKRLVLNIQAGQTWHG